MSSHGRAHTSIAPPRPTRRALDRFLAEVRRAADARGLPTPVADRYVEWILVFVAWGLRAPPGRLHRDRIGGFWTALAQRRTGRSEICNALDAVAFLFGSVEDVDTLLFPSGRSERRSPTGSGRVSAVNAPPSRSDDAPIGEPNEYRPNPKLRLSDPRPPVKRDPGAPDDLAQYLPEGTLPDRASAREAIPTRAPTEREDVISECAPNDCEEVLSECAPTDREERSSKRVPIPDSLPPSPQTPPDEPSGDASGQEKPTLFNPEGARHGTSSSEPAADGAPPNDPTDGLSDSSSHCTDANPDDEEKVPIPVPSPLADRVRRVAHRLGLPPNVFAARALEMVCDDIGIEASDEDDLPPMLDQFQARLDLLHLEEQDPEHSVDPSS